MRYLGVNFFLLSEGILTEDANKKVLKHYKILLMDLMGGKDNITFRQDNCPCNFATNFKSHFYQFYSMTIKKFKRHLIATTISYKNQPD